MARPAIVVKDGRISVRSLAVGLIARIGKTKSAQLMTEISEQIKAPAPTKAVKTAGAKSVGLAHDVEAVKGVAPQKGQLPAGLMRWLKANRKTGVKRARAAAGAKARKRGKREMA